jgi:hypothetical protein
MEKSSQAIKFNVSDFADPTMSKVMRNNEFIYEQIGHAIDKADAALAAAKTPVSLSSTGARATTIVVGGSSSVQVLNYQVEDLV